MKHDAAGLVGVDDHRGSGAPPLISQRTCDRSVVANSGASASSFQIVGTPEHHRAALALDGAPHLGRVEAAVQDDGAAGGEDRQQERAEPARVVERREHRAHVVFAQLQQTAVL